MAAETDARWVPVAVSADILNATVVPARLPTGQIAVWRSACGSLYANGDRCPHRGMRLSHGFIRGETLSCIYHGWRFGTDGACQKIPAHPAVVPPDTLNCGPLKVAEANGVVWGSSGHPETGPIAFEGLNALRSLVIAASAEAIIAACDGETDVGAIKAHLGGHDTRLLINIYGPDEVLVIVLVDDAITVSDRLAISTAVEALRRTAETVVDAA